MSNQSNQSHHNKRRSIRLANKSTVNFEGLCLTKREKANHNWSDYNHNHIKKNIIKKIIL